MSCSAFVLLLLERRGARWLEVLFGVVIGVEAVRSEGANRRQQAEDADSPQPAGGGTRRWQLLVL